MKLNDLVNIHEDSKEVECPRCKKSDKVFKSIKESGLYYCERCKLKFKK
jgi:ribosomal protein L37AE/L43A